MNDVVRRLPVREARRGSMGDRVRRLSREGFVGRTEQRNVFASALRGDHDAPQVLLVHGAGGMGKSALLRRFADDAQECGRAVVWIDGEYVVASTTALTEAAEPVHHTDSPVLIIDGFEHCQVLETWLREHFLRTVPADTIVVIAGRQRPEPQWTLDPGWRQLVHTTALTPLNPCEVAALLEDRGVPEALHTAVNGFADGHPLALCMAAEETLTKDAAPDDTVWEPSPRVIESLLARVIDQVPSPAHEYGLRVCGHVRHVTLDLLRTGLDDHDAHTVFDWLAHLPYVEVRQHGLVCHELVRDVLDASFKWRDPNTYNELHLNLWRHLLKGPSTALAASTSSTSKIKVALLDLFDLSRAFGSALDEVLDLQSFGSVLECDYTPDLREELLALARADRGEEHARLVAYWLDRHPEAFQIYRHTEDLTVVSFFTWLQLHPDTDDLTSDPALVPVREHLDRRPPLSAGEHIGIARFSVPEQSSENYIIATILNTACAATLSHHARGGLAATFMLLPNADAAVSQIEPFDHWLVRAMPEYGEGGWGMFVHDWREVPLEAHLDRLEKTMRHAIAPTRDAPVAPSLPQDEFAAAAKQALRDWHDDEAFATNALIRTYGDPAALRTAITTTVDALRRDADHLKHHRVVHTTYLERDTNQRAAAARLGVPFSTYRRHLQAGLDTIVATLWHTRPTT
ncbi:ATP-binding protein [Amycolatopsis minnesotensis]|uniref:ATP-binding protein n=1 Tax=Amycolatopsis minnesotensis TaxID=337894 RepID=A0ABN2S7W8_9PSEU